MADLSERVQEVADGPNRVKGDAGEVESHDLKDLVEAARYLDGQQASRQKTRGLRFTKLVPPGAS